MFDRFRATLAFSLALLSSVAGLLLSWHFSLPSGPAIILSAGAVYAASLVFGPAGGILAQRTPHQAGA